MTFDTNDVKGFLHISFTHAVKETAFLPNFISTQISAYWVKRSRFLDTSRKQTLACCSFELTEYSNMQLEASNVMSTQSSVYTWIYVLEAVSSASCNERPVWHDIQKLIVTAVTGRYVFSLSSTQQAVCLTSLISEPLRHDVITSVGHRYVLVV